MPIEKTFDEIKCECNNYVPYICIYTVYPKEEEVSTHICIYTTHPKEEGSISKYL